MAQKAKRTQFDIMHPLFTALAESDLSSTERLLMISLFRYVDSEGTCFPSYQELMKATALSKPTIASNIKKLSQKGWITYKQGSNTKQQANTYHLNLIKIGIETKPEQKKVVALDRRYLAEDGNYYESPSAYFKAKHNL